MIFLILISSVSHAEILHMMKMIEYEIDDFLMLREKLEEKSYISGKMDMVVGEGAFANIEFKIFRVRIKNLKIGQKFKEQWLKNFI